MNILHLKYAAEIEKTGSLNKAAENLYMGQPNLSRAIKELEASLGITIFERSAKGMVATPEGEEFLQHAKKILAHIEEVENIYKTGVPVKQKFSVSVPRDGYISEAFAQFSKSIDSSVPAELTYKETDSTQVIKDVIESDCKLGIIRCGADYDRQCKALLSDKGLTYELVAEFESVLLMNSVNPLAQKDDIRYDDLKPYVEIHCTDPLVPFQLSPEVKKEDFPEMTDKHIFVFDRASQLELLSENQNAFMWASHMPEKMLDRYAIVHKICRDNRRVYKDILIRRKDYSLTDLDKRFITELCKAKRRYF